MPWHVWFSLAVLFVLNSVMSYAAGKRVGRADTQIETIGAEIAAAQAEFNARRDEMRRRFDEGSLRRTTGEILPKSSRRKGGE